jgi:hypothetical protein
MLIAKVSSAFHRRPVNLWRSILQYWQKCVNTSTLCPIHQIQYDDEDTMELEDNINALLDKESLLQHRRVD